MFQHQPILNHRAMASVINLTFGLSPPFQPHVSGNRPILTLAFVLPDFPANIVNFPTPASFKTAVAVTSVAGPEVAPEVGV